jgi:hypothetical protein
LEGLDDAEPLLPSEPRPAANGAWKSLVRQFCIFLTKYRMFFQAQGTCILAVNIFVYGSVMVVPDTFFFISLEREYDSSRTFNGLCTTVSTIACLPIFWWSILNNVIFKYGNLLLSL